MIKLKKILGMLVITTLLVGNVQVVDATELEEEKEKLEELEQQEADAEEEKQRLSDELDTVVAEMQELQANIIVMDEKMRETGIELDNAKAEERKQYEDMKKRIRFMYENGETQVLEIILSGTSISDILNKIEYATQVNEYDRDKLKEYEDLVKEVEEKQAQLEEEIEALTIMQDQIIEKQAELERLLEETNIELESLEGEIDEKAELIQELIEKAEEEERRRQEAANNANGSGGLVSPSAPVISGNGTFAHPVPAYNYISSPYGWRSYGGGQFHKGTDFAAPTGTPVYAAMDGVVTTASYHYSAGNWVIINHGNGFQTIYMHNSAFAVSVGDVVKKGQNISFVGSTGNSTGPHLHFQVSYNGATVDPMNYL